MKISYSYILLVALSMAAVVCADNDTVGSQTVISQEASFAFTGVNNRIALAAVMGGGFSLADSLTSVTYDSALFVAGPIALNDGNLILQQDLVLAASGMLTSPGRVSGQARAVLFPCDKKVTFSSASSSYIFNNTHLCFNSDVCIDMPMRFEGECFISGRGTLVDLENSGQLLVAPDSRLCMRNLFIKGIGSSAGNIVFLSDTAELRLSNVDIELVDTVTTTIGSVYVDGPGNWYLKEYDWVFEQAATLTVDGVTLWKDPLDTSRDQAGTINVGINQANFDSVRSGTIKCVVSADETALPSDSQIIIDIPHQNSDTLLSMPHQQDFIVGSIASKMLTDNIYLAPNRRLRVSLDSLLHGSTRYIHFARTSQPTLLIDPGVTLSLAHVTLKNFTPGQVRYGDENSRLFFGPGTTIELGECSAMKALVGGVERSITWTFRTDSTAQGACLKGLGNRLSLPQDNVVSLYVEPRATLTLHHIQLYGVGSAQQNIQLGDSSSRLALKEAHLMLTGDYTCSQGIIEVIGDTTISGSYTFAYQSSQTSYVRSNAQLTLDYNMTLSYDAIPGLSVGQATKQKIMFEDLSSVLHLRGACLHATNTGFMFEHGTLRVEDHCRFISEGQTYAQASILVESLSNIDILADATLSIQGLLETR